MNINININRDSGRTMRILHSATMAKCGVQILTFEFFCANLVNQVSGCACVRVIQAVWYPGDSMVTESMGVKSCPIAWRF